MIDFVKIKLINTNPKVLLNNQLLDFKYLVSVKSGELSNNMIARYKGMKFIIYVSGTIIISGSLHKYMNNGVHNYNDFSRTQLLEVIYLFTTTFNLSSRNCTLVNLEVGANVTPTIPTKELLKYLYMHFRKEFKYGDFKNGTFKQVSYSEYYLKAYDKASQYHLSGEIFRFEIKMIASRVIRKYGVATVEDLKNKFVLQKLGNLLITRWGESLVYDPSIEKDLLFHYDNIYDKYIKWGNPIYWHNLNIDKEAHRNKFSKEMKKYRDLMIAFPDNLQLQITKILYEKLTSLLSSEK